MKKALLALALLVLALVSYGVAIEPRLLLDAQETEAEVPALPPGWDGQTVALLADLQVGMWLDNPGMVSSAVRRALDEGADLALIAGDFVYKPDSAGVREAVALVAPLPEAGVPTYAVLGNHDYSLMKRDSELRPGLADYLRDRLGAAGVRVLDNEAAAVGAPNGDILWVAGVGSVWAGDADPDAALASVPDDAPRVVLMHNATSFRDIPGGQAPLALAAHTHGGQIRIAGPTTSWLDIVQEGEVVADGWAEPGIGAPGNRLYVNRGIGFSTVPIRIRCRPELTLITLRQSNPAGTEAAPPRVTDTGVHVRGGLALGMPLPPRLAPQLW